MNNVRPRILFVDDEQALLNGVRRALRDHDSAWDMTFLNDSLAALELAKLNGFDVIVTDLRMPGLTGLELLDRLRKEGVSAQVIILTGTGDMDSALKAINSLGVFRYYTKPCPASVLATGIEEAILEAGLQSDAAAYAASALDALPLAALAVDAQAKVLFANRSGGELLAARAPIALDGGGYCRALSVKETLTLHETIQDVARGGHATVLALAGRDNEDRFSILVEPPAKACSETAALLFVRRINDQDAPSSATLQHLFSLSPTEANLAHQLARGLDLKEASEELGITLNTARTYLRAIFQKTSVNRQSELIRLFNTSIAGR
jgi:DNA-binding NarL/FixJ family response regulator